MKTDHEPYSSDLRAEAQEEQREYKERLNELIVDTARGVDRILRRGK